MDCLAFAERFAKGFDPPASGVPSLLTGVDCDAMVDEPSPNRALHFIDSTVEGFTILDERPELTMALGGHVDRFELADGRHASELEGVVLVGLAFDVAPLPCVFIGGADESLVAEADCEVVYPAGRPARFHDDEIAFVFFEEGLKVVSVGGCVEKGVFASF